MKIEGIEELIALRKYLHAHPEVSEDEYHTAITVAEHLAPYHPDQLIPNVGGTGILAIYEGDEPGPTLLFRSELDALPIQEINTFAHRSTVDHVSHKCGHDGHSTILIGLAKHLYHNPLPQGKVVLLFQPAEENGVGAAAMLADDKFEAAAPDYVFALHNLPGYPLHEIVVREEAFTPAVKSIIIKLNGKTAHAAEPEHGDNPALAIAEILQQSLALSNNDPDRKDFTLVTPIHIMMGELAYGISAGYGEVHLTMRAWTQEKMEHLADAIAELALRIAKEHQLHPVIEWTQEFDANMNEKSAVDLVRAAAKSSNLSVTERAYPFKFGEDFGSFTQKYNGAMFGLGSGENCPALHNPDYDFPDELIASGISIFSSIIQKSLR